MTSTSAANPAEQSDKTSENAATTPGPAFPKKMLIFTAIVLSTVVATFFFLSELDDATGIGLDVVMVASMFLSALLVLTWVIWFLFLSRWEWPSRLMSATLTIGLPLLFLYLFRPVLGGDVNFIGFRPIWASEPEAPSADVAVKAVAVDLITETANDFAQFLGPNQNQKITLEAEIDRANFASAKLLWKQPIGTGWSGFVARNGFAVTMEQRVEQECVTCYEIETGTLKWIYSHHARHRDQMNLGRVGPRSTPTIHQGKVYAIGAVGNFVCLDGSDGTVVWQIDLNKLLNIEINSATDDDGMLIQYESNSALSWGRSGSPLIVGDTVVIPGGGPSKGDIRTLLAFDLLTGEQRWAGGTEMIAYGSPTLAKVAGVEQILMVAETQAMGFDPTNGNVLWNFKRPGETNGGANTSQLTVVSDNEVMTTKGYLDGGAELIRLENTDGKLTPSPVWKNDISMRTKLTSPVIFNGHAYALSNGFLDCVRLSDGKRIWKHRGRFGHGQILLVNDLLLLHSETGTLHLMEISEDGYEDLGSVETVTGTCWNTICVFADKVLVRSDIEAACVQLPVK